MEKEKEKKYNCIFGGGAARGFAYIGCIRAMDELSIVSNKIAGSSVGAIFAALYALGCNYEACKQILDDFSVFVFKDLNFSFGANFAISKGDVFEDWLRKQIEKYVYGDNYKENENPPVKFSNLRKDLYILATDLRTNERTVFSRENTPDFEVAKAIRTSCCFPGLMVPVEYDDKLLIDGDLSKCMPLWLIDDSFSKSDYKVLEFRLEGKKTHIHIKNFIDYFDAVYSSLSNFCTTNITEQYKNSDKYNVVVIDTKDVLLMDFTMKEKERQKLIDIGYNTTMKYFESILPQKNKTLFPKYEKIISLITEIKKEIKSDNPDKIRKIIGDFFMRNTDILNCIDCNISEDFYNLMPEITKFLEERNFINRCNPKLQKDLYKKFQDLLEKTEKTKEELKVEL